MRRVRIRHAACYAAAELLLLFAARPLAAWLTLAARPLAASMPLIAAVMLPCAAAGASAQTTATENWNAKFQATYVWQRKPSFPAAYSGPNSLSPQREESYSYTMSAALGLRPWSGGELYFNPEAAQGVPLSRLTGLGGFTNGEIARTSGRELTFYRARLFVRHTVGLGGKPVPVESDANQLAGMVETRRLVFTAGNLSVLDIFDDNTYSHDARTQFLNWSLMTHGAYDYAADARGYSWGFATEWYAEEWAVRAGRFLQPKLPNQLRLDPRIGRHYGDQIELEHAHSVGGQPGKMRLLAFRNRARMSSYDDALELAARTGAAPDLNAVRTSDQDKHGVGLNIEQAVTANLGMFGRASWADGGTEAYAFTEIDRSLSTGMVIKGGAWGRGQDTLGIAYARNGLSASHREYLARGGMGFFIGDGRLTYRPEALVEVFYSLRPTRHAWVSLDVQRIQNPAYNADRGPVLVTAARLHAEF